MKSRTNLFITIMLIVVLCGPAWAVDVNQPIAHWPFDEGAGSTAYDSVGSNDGTIYGAAWTTGWINGALRFDGLNDYVYVPDDPNQQIATNQLTLSAWIRLDTDVVGTQRRIIDKHEQARITWGMEIFGDGYCGSTGNQLVFHDSDGATSFSTCLSPTDLNTDQWYHVAATDDAGIIKLYIDGQFNQDSNDGYGIPSSINAPILIGRSSSIFGYFFDGKIDDVRLYDCVLSAEEIEQLSLIDVCPVGHWTFDEVAGSTAYDSVGTNDETIYVAA